MISSITIRNEKREPPTAKGSPYRPPTQSPLYSLFHPTTFSFYITSISACLLWPLGIGSRLVTFKKKKIKEYFYSAYKSLTFSSPAYIPDKLSIILAHPLFLLFDDDGGKKKKKKRNPLRLVCLWLPTTPPRVIDAGPITMEGQSVWSLLSSRRLVVHQFTIAGSLLAAVDMAWRNNLSNLYALEWKR